MKEKFLTLSVFALFILLGCGKGKQPTSQTAHLDNTPYQLDSILMTYATHPQRALVLLDSAIILGNINDFDAQYTRAKIYSKSLTEQHQDSAITICEALLQLDTLSNDNKELVVDLLINISRSKSDNNEYLRWATAKAQLCKELGEEVELLRTEAEIGVVMNLLGQTDKGLAKIDHSISQLDQPGSIDRMDAFIIASKRKITVLNQLKRYEETIPLAQHILDRLNHFEQHADEYADDSYRLPWSKLQEDCENYIDFSRAQAHGFLAIAYAMTGQDANAQEHLTAFDQSNYGKTFSSRRMIIPAQIALGKDDEALETCEKMTLSMGTDTMNENYSTILRYRAMIAQHKGHFAEAYQLMDRHSRLNMVISDSLHKSEAHDYAARYHAQEQEAKIQQAESESLLKSIITIGITLLLVITTLGLFHFRRQNKHIAIKNQVLVRMINNRESQLDSKDDQETDDHQVEEKSFAAIDAAIRNEQLYTNPTLQRQDICDRFGISRVTLNNMLQQHRGNPSLPQYINTIRMEEAIKLLREHKNIPISVIAETVGFSPANLRLHFVRNFGMTPIEYRQNL